jgi:DNA-directed RNA polymerase subunit RPC12/RpoP
VTPEATERFGIGKGRERPPYKPKDIHCPSCGAGLTVKDEASELVVCEYCGSHIDTGEHELKVLGKGSQRKWDFPISLGDSFRHKNVRFEVLARLAYTEDNDLTELTREYYLFNPTHGPMWLSEYKGNYSISTPSHVMTKDDAFSKRRGDALQTHDGQSWVMEETGVYKLEYVDGALPWVAGIGDQIHYAEATEKSGSGRQLEVQSHGKEIEIGIGRTIPVSAVARAMGKMELLQRQQVKLTDSATKRKQYMSLIKLTAAALLVNAILWIVCMSSGTLVLQQGFQPAELTQETLSNQFYIAKAGSALRVKVGSTGLNNAWMALNVGVVKGDDTIIHTLEADLSYYHGVEGGESWSEGSQTKTTYIEVPEPGNYRMLVQAISASGSANTAEQCQHAVQLRVYDGAYMPHHFCAGTIISLIALVIVGVAYNAWKKQEE